MVVADLLVDAPLGLIEERRQVAPAQVQAHRQVALVHLPRDGGLALGEADLRDLGQRDMRAVGRRQHEIADRLRVAARRAGKARDHVVAALLDKDLRHRAAADAGLDQRHHVGDVDAEAGGGRAVDIDAHLRQRRLLVDDHVLRARHGLQQMLDLGGQLPRLAEIVAVDLDHQVAVRARQLVQHAVDHRLREADVDARQLPEALGHLGDQLLLVAPGLPLVVRMQRHRALDVRRRERIGAVVIAPDLGDDVLDLGKLQRRRAQRVGHPARLVEREPRRQGDLQPDRPFVEVRQEVAPDRSTQDHHAGQGRHRQADHRARLAHQPGQQRLVARHQPVQHRVLEHLGRLAIGPVRQARNQQQRHQQGTEQREADRERHRREQFVLDALESEQRQVGDDDDQHAEEDRPRDLARRRQDVVAVQLAFGILFAPAQDVLHHHDGAVDDDAEVDRAQRQQVGRNLEVVHQDERRQQRQRDRDGHDDRRARAAQEQQQHDRHQRHALDERLAHRMHGGVDQLAAVDIRHDLHVLGQDVLVQVAHGVVHAGHHARRVLVLEQQRDALDGVRVVVHAQDAVPLAVTQHHAAEVLDQHRHAVLLADDDVAQVVEVADQAHAADHQSLLAALHDAAARVRVVGGNGLRDLVQREVVLGQPGRIQLQHELRGHAAEVDHVHHARHLLEAGDDLPELQLGQLAQVPRLGLQRVAEDLADRRGQRIQPGLGAVRQRHAADALLQPLARPVVFGAVLEHHRDQRQAEGALRAHHVHAGRAHDLALQRDRDLLLHLFRGQAVDLRDHLRGRVGDVGVGLQRQLRPAMPAIERREQEHQDDNAAPVEAQGDEAFNH